MCSTEPSPLPEEEGVNVPTFILLPYLTVVLAAIPNSLAFLNETVLDRHARPSYLQCRQRGCRAHAGQDLVPKDSRRSCRQTHRRRARVALYRSAYHERIHQ